eukprot:gene7648-11969_t
MKIEHFNLNHDISNLDFDQIKQCKPKHVSTKKPQKLTTNNTEPFKLGEIEEEILKVLSERITKTFERYYKNSLKLNFPTLESNHEKVDLSKLEIDTDLFEQSYFKYDEKNLGIELNEEFLIKANGIRNSEKFLKEKGVLNDLEKKSLAPNSKEKTKKKEGLVKWFGMEKPIMTPELRLELEALRLRHTLSGRGKEQKEQFEKPEYFQIEEKREIENKPS